MSHWVAWSILKPFQSEHWSGLILTQWLPCTWLAHQELDQVRHNSGKMAWKWLKCCAFFSNLAGGDNTCKLIFELLYNNYKFRGWGNLHDCSNQTQAGNDKNKNNIKTSIFTQKLSCFSNSRNPQPLDSPDVFVMRRNSFTFPVH